MPPPSYPNVNGNKHSWASIVLLIGTTRIRGFKAVNYKNAMEPGDVRGEGVQVIGRTRGELKSEGSLELYLEEYHQLIAALAADGTGYLEKGFEITVSYSEPGSAIITDRLIGCRLKGGDKGFSPGTDALSVKCDLSIMYVIENGVHPISDPQGVS
jgi:hypothetical protein